MVDSPSMLAAEIRKLEQKHEEDPNGRYFVPLANAYRQLGELEHAEVLLTDGLKRHPEYLSAHIVLGRCYLDRGAVDAAEEEFRRVLAIDAQNLIALRTLGEMAAEQGRQAEAERWYAELLAADPLNEEARRALVGLAQPAGSGEAEDSLSTEEDGVELVGEAEDGELITETIAELYARQGVYDRAAAVYRELLRRRPAPELSRRLREIEELAVGKEPGRSAPPSPAAAEELPEAPATIADYLAELLAWAPGAAAPAVLAATASSAESLASDEGEHEYAAPSLLEETADEVLFSSGWTAQDGSQAGTDNGDGHPESFQKWLRSLKR